MITALQAIGVAALVVIALAVIAVLFGRWD